MKTTLYIIIAFLFIVYSISVYELGKSKAQTKIIKDTDTLTVYVSITDTLIVPKFITEIKIDTIKTTDSIYVIDQTQYIAEVDTTYENELAHLKVRYISDIPLSRNSFFNIDLNVKKETVFVPTYKENDSFWNHRFAPVFGVGALYTQEGKADVGLFLGFGIRIN